jgi:hypothetical protein
MLLQHTISSLMQEFTMKYLRPLHHFLGVFAQQRPDGIFLSLSQYALDILECADIVDCKLVSTPVDI